MLHLSTTRTATLKSLVRFSAPPEVTGMLSLILISANASQIFIVVNAQIRLLPASVYVERLAATRNPILLFDFLRARCYPELHFIFISFTDPSLRSSMCPILYRSNQPAQIG
jgi:hypothetical protein